jgi:hypothetical protein
VGSIDASGAYCIPFSEIYNWGINKSSPAEEQKSAAIKKMKQTL